jgi:hypothetical protein
MNSYNQNWGGNSWNNPNWGTPYSQQPNTNKVYVTSLDDALSRMAPRGSELVYFHQDANEFYVVRTDPDGRKSWVGFTYTVPNQDLNTPATKADLKEVLERLEKLEKKGEVISDGQSDG